MTKPSNKANRFDRIRHAFSRIAVIFTNTVLLLVLLNAALALLFLINDHFWPEKSNQVVQRYGAALKEDVYPDMTEDEIYDLLDETWSQRFTYDPWVEFKEIPRNGDYVNIDEAGFRRVANQGPWPPNTQDHLVVFMFGGSTTFGYGVSDEDTVASYLQDILQTHVTDRDVYVYNFGRGWYYSTQERVLFERLLSAGHVPHIAIFMDGLNDFKGEYMSDGTAIDACMDNDSSPFLEMIFRLPMTRLARSVTARTGYGDPLGNLIDPGSGSSVSILSTDVASSEDELIDYTLGRYQRNKAMIEAISSVFETTSVFVWQPVASYDYNPELFPYVSDETGILSTAYPSVLDMKNNGDLGDNFIWCASIQSGTDKVLYVDGAHYNPELSNMVAACIADGMVHNNQLPEY